MSILGSVSL